MRFQNSLALVLMTALATTVFGETSAVDDVQNEPTQYKIWRTGCSRSLAVLETHTDLSAALNAALRLQQQRDDVMVLVGKSDWSDALQVLRHHRGAETDRSSIECAVYERGCRSLTWRPSRLKQTDVAASEAVLALRIKEGATALAVYRVLKH